MRISKTRPLRHQTGFTLMEAMVALLIFSVGLLGLAAMQMSGLQNNHVALMRTYAIQQTYDIADRIRSRRNGANALADVAAWNNELPNILPGGRGQVAATPGIPGAFDITVFWDEDRTGATGLGCAENNPNDLRCLRLTILP